MNNSGVGAGFFYFFQIGKFIIDLRNLRSLFQSIAFKVWYPKYGILIQARNSILYYKEQK